MRLPNDTVALRGQTIINDYALRFHEWAGGRVLYSQKKWFCWHDDRWITGRNARPWIWHLMTAFNRVNIQRVKALYAKETARAFDARTEREAKAIMMGADKALRDAVGFGNIAKKDAAIRVLKALCQTDQPPTGAAYDGALTPSPASCESC